MPRLRNIIGIGLVGLGLTGCVPAEQYAGMKMKADQLAEQLGHSQSEINEANARASAAERQLASTNNNGQNKDAIINSQAQTIAELTAQNNDLNQKYAQALNQPVRADSPDSLNPVLTSELNKFAEQNPDLVEFDPKRGIVKFKSDVTFAVGDATVTPKAKEVLTRFSSILTSASAGGYSLLVAGHTDNQPVASEHTKRLGHFNNWYLSAHRAIAVETELSKDGVSAKSMGVIGYADEQPVATNSTEAGKAANRRVEVLIVPKAFSSGNSVAMTDSTPTAPRSTHKKAAVAADKAVPAGAKMDGNK